MSSFQITVFATTSFVALHRWADAPPTHAYLRSPHRHTFNVKAEVETKHHDRDVEFIALKERIDAAIVEIIPITPMRATPYNQLSKSGNDPINWSCERWAIELITRCGLTACTVDEDGENGARVELRRP